MKLIQLRSGNTIIEVLIAVLIVGTVMTALSVSMSYSIHNTSQAQYRDTATSLATEPLEVLRHQRATSNWQTFYSDLSSKAGATRYITASPFTGTSDLKTTNSPPFSLNNVAFVRKIEITVNSADQITVRSIVEWSRNSATTSTVTFEQQFFNTQLR